ncbi:hypothetical protein GCM10027404_12380 [Arthrobacter tumbae]|uniref:DUF2975 domain-containing protein n=1 Tax=Arthrobacter tumbae TaxID=163874 RepID=UPI00195D5403|nr:DUF2975 domain-containing protein [Arthrobacter tumbae]MBM7782521.1 hypothetical protein [Arthrobacter tumbae]
MTGQQVAFGRVLIGALAAGSLLAQFVLVPQVASDAAERYPEVAHLEIPYLTAVVAALGFFEVALLAAWRLLAVTNSAVAGKERLGLTGGSKRWIDVMTASLCSTALIFAGICVHAGSVENIGGPAMLFGLLASLSLTVAVVVLRSKVSAPQIPAP